MEEGRLIILSVVKKQIPARGREHAAVSGVRSCEWQDGVSGFH
jgi:hypothetical protein